MTTSWVYSEWNPSIVLTKLVSINYSIILLQTPLGHTQTWLAVLIVPEELISNNDFHIARKYAKITKLTLHANSDPLHSQTMMTKKQYPFSS
jgi:hypothetical protein